MLEGTLADRRREGRVDDRDRPLDRTDLVEVDERHLRVRGRLGDDEHRAAGDDRGFERPGRRAVDERHVDAEARAGALQEQLGARVDVALGDDVIAGRAERHDRRRDRTHAGRERERSLRAFERGDRVFERLHRRVRVAGVEALGAWHGRHPARFVEARRHERARRPQRRGERGVGFVAARTDRDGVGPDGLVFGRHCGCSFCMSSRNVVTASPTWSRSIRNESCPWSLSISTYSPRPPVERSTSRICFCWYVG